MQKQEKEHDHLFKIVLIGDSAVGKSNILSRFVKGEFNPESKTTIGVEFATKNITLDQKRIKLQVWDTAGQERFRSMASAYYRGAMGALLVYDITRRNTFENLDKWVKELKNFAEEGIVTVLIGNKSDLRQFRSVKTEQGEEYAGRNSMIFLETSALDSSNIDEAFNLAVQEIAKHEKVRSTSKKPEEPKVVIKSGMDQILQQQPARKKCC